METWFRGEREGGRGREGGGEEGRGQGGRGKGGVGEREGGRQVTWKPTRIVVYHSTGSMTDVPHSVAVEMEKKSIFKNNSIGDIDLLSETLFHPLDCRSGEKRELQS